MKSSSIGSTHLKSVTFEINYPPSPFYPRTPVRAQFSGVMNADDRVYAKLDSGLIPDTSSLPGIAITGLFTVDANEETWRFSGFLCNSRIEANAERA
jgi:hypothetical protein